MMMRLISSLLILAHCVIGHTKMEPSNFNEHQGQSISNQRESNSRTIGNYVSIMILAILAHCCLMLANEYGHCRDSIVELSLCGIYFITFVPGIVMLLISSLFPNHNPFFICNTI